MIKKLVIRKLSKKIGLILWKYGDIKIIDYFRDLIFFGICWEIEEYVL